MDRGASTIEPAAAGPAGAAAAGTVDHYAVLGLRSDASADEVRSAFRRLARRWHPDSVGTDEAQAAGDTMARVNEAYAVLSDPHRRTEHDLALRAARRPAAAPRPADGSAAGLRAPVWLAAGSALLVGSALAGWTLWRPAVPAPAVVLPAAAVSGPLAAAPPTTAAPAAASASPEDQPLRLVATRELVRLPASAAAARPARPASTVAAAR
jgi:hypothetical protein